MTSGPRGEGRAETAMPGTILASQKVCSQLRDEVLSLGKSTFIYVIKGRYKSLDSSVAGNTLAIESSSDLREETFLSFTEHQPTPVSFSTRSTSPTPFPAHLQLKQAAGELSLLTAQLRRGWGSCCLTSTLKVTIVFICPGCFLSPPGKQKNSKHPKQSSLEYTNCLCKGRWN